jgi:excisionase family DNA binding protein
MNPSKTKFTPSPYIDPKPETPRPSGSADIPFSLQERLYSAEEVAERLGVSERWIRDHATRRNPRIRAVKLGPLLRFRETDIAAFVAAQTTRLPRNTRGNL